MGKPVFWGGVGGGCGVGVRVGVGVRASFNASCKAVSCPYISAVHTSVLVGFACRMKKIGMFEEIDAS